MGNEIQRMTRLQIQSSLPFQNRNVVHQVFYDGGFPVKSTILAVYPSTFAVSLRASFVLITPNVP